MLDVISRRGPALRRALSASVGFSLVATALLTSPTAANGEAQWADQFGNPVAVVSGVDVATTADAVYMVYQLGNGGWSYLRKYSHAGDMAWERTLGGNQDTEMRAVEADASGIYISGITGHALPGQPAPHGLETFVARYSAAGSLIWARQFSLPALGELSGRGVTPLRLTSAGIFVAGDGETTSFLRMYDRDGNSLWTQNVPAHLETLSADGTGAMVLASNIDGTSPTMRSFSNAGALRFTRAATGFRHSAAPGSAGGFFVAYHSAPSVTNPGDVDRGFITHYNAGGLATWTHQYGGQHFGFWGGITQFGSRLYATWKDFDGSYEGPQLDRWAALSTASGNQIWRHDFALQPGSTILPGPVDAGPEGGYITGMVPNGLLVGQVPDGGAGGDAFVMKFTIDDAPPSILETGYALPPMIPLRPGDFTLEGKWTIADAISGVSTEQLQETSDGSTWNNVLLSEPRPTNALIDVKPNEAHRFRVQATDRSGNVSPWKVSPWFQTDLRQQNAAGTSYDSNWKPATLAGASGGSVMTTQTAGATAKFSFTGNAIGLVAPRGPNRGKVAVFIDGNKVATVDLSAPAFSNQWLVFSMNFASVKAHLMTMVAKGTPGRPRVDIDAFEVLSTLP